MKQKYKEKIVRVLVEEKGRELSPVCPRPQEKMGDEIIFRTEEDFLDFCGIEQTGINFRNRVVLAGYTFNYTSFTERNFDAYWLQDDEEQRVLLVIRPYWWSKTFLPRNTLSNPLGRSYTVWFNRSVPEGYNIEFVVIGLMP